MTLRRQTRDVFHFFPPVFHARDVTFFSERNISISKILRRPRSRGHRANAETSTTGSSGSIYALINGHAIMIPRYESTHVLEFSARSSVNSLVKRVMACVYLREILSRVALKSRTNGTRHWKVYRGVTFLLTLLLSLRPSVTHVDRS